MGATFITVPSELELPLKLPAKPQPCSCSALAGKTSPRRRTIAQARRILFTSLLVEALILDRLLIPTVSDRGPDRALSLSRAPYAAPSHENPGPGHGPSGGHAVCARDLLPNSLQNIPRAHSEVPTNERQHTVPESNSLYASSSGVQPDTNNPRPIHIRVRVWLGLELRKPLAAVAACRS